MDRLEISGPYRAETPEDTPSRRRIFICTPSSALGEDACAAQIVSALAHRAYRRPVNQTDVQPLMDLYREGRGKGSFEHGIESALRGILVDPEFLFHIERDPPNAAPGSVYRLSDVELASRLSFFLWSSIPDDELRDLAAHGGIDQDQRDPGDRSEDGGRRGADRRRAAHS